MSSTVSRIAVCRGCCCGTLSKHPGVDHAGQLSCLRELPADTAVVTATGCLGQCDRGNNIVVIPSPSGRLHGGRVVWFGQMLRPELIDAVMEWITAGGPGVVPIPAVLAGHHFDPRSPATLVPAATSESV